MEILSHRGFWLNSSEKNSFSAFDRSFKNSMGTETDVRDSDGRLVISHDIAKNDCMEFEDFLNHAALHNDSNDYTLALNIKSDGLALMLENALAKHPSLRAFVFDMSIPDMRTYFETKIEVFARLSEVENIIPWSDKISGVWLDSFEGSDWYTVDFLEKLLIKYRVCIVSDELHNRDETEQWNKIKSLSDNEHLLLCTDFPDKAKKFFGEMK